MRISVLLTLIIAFTGSFCNAQQNKVLSSVLWKVQSPHSEKSSYILGSTHLFGRDWIDSYKVLDSLVGVQEIFLCENTQALGDNNKHEAIEPFYPNNLKARTIFGENFNFVDGYFAKINGFGIEKYIDESKSPGGALFFLVYYLLNEIATKNNLKVSSDFIAMDDVLLFKANSMKKKCVGLDSLIQIKKILSSQSVTDTLVSSIIQLVRTQKSDLSMKKNKPVNEFLKGMTTYNQGKYAYNFTYGQSLNTEGGLKVVSRNNFWMEKLPHFLTNQSCFIVVGNGHLDGKKGIISLLRKQGFKIYPVELK